MSPICPSTIISYFGSPEASLGTSASRSILSSIVFSLDRNKPVIGRVSIVFNRVEDKENCIATCSYRKVLRWLREDPISWLVFFSSLG